MEAIAMETGTRISWTKQTCPGQGIYMFGGQNVCGHVNNDLWLIEPLYNYNNRLLSSERYEFVTSKPALCLTIDKITDFKGRPPCSRTQSASTVIRNPQKEHLLVIYGGRNDGIFGGTQNVALNDINIFNTVTREWTSLAMYGLLPCSRWAHSIV